MVPRPGDHHPRRLPLPRRHLLPAAGCRGVRPLVHKAWPSARLHAHILSPLPSGTFPGVDDTELYAFLDAHSKK